MANYLVSDEGYKNTYDLVHNNSALSLSIQNWSSEVINGDFGGHISQESPEPKTILRLGSLHHIIGRRGLGLGDPYSKPYPTKTYLFSYWSASVRKATLPLWLMVVTALMCLLITPNPSNTTHG